MYPCFFKPLPLFSVKLTDLIIQMTHECLFTKNTYKNEAIDDGILCNKSSDKVFTFLKVIVFTFIHREACIYVFVTELSSYSRMTF